MEERRHAGEPAIATGLPGRRRREHDYGPRGGKLRQRAQHALRLWDIRIEQSSEDLERLMRTPD